MAIKDEQERYQLYGSQYAHASSYSHGIKSEKRCAPMDPRVQPEPARTLPVTPHQSYQLLSCLSPQTSEAYLQSYSRPATGFNLDNMPRDIIDRICRQMPYEQIFPLRRVTKSLCRVVNPYVASEDSRVSFVMRAERDFPQHRARGIYNYGCYICSRVLPPFNFDSEQHLQAYRRDASGKQTLVNLRRYCIPCGMGNGLHSSGDLLVRRTGQRQWICDCLMILDVDESNCSQCRTICPYRAMGMGSRA